jgi:hypothetical protein
MATYRYRVYLAETQAEIFDFPYQQGEIIFHFGIYRCMECERETVLSAHHLFPACGRHPSEGHTFWRLIVRANQ